MESQSRGKLRLRFGGLFLWILLLAVAFGLCGRALAQSVSAPPKTRTDNVRDTVHGVEIVDPYRWLENQSSPETREWLNGQNQYTRKVLDSLSGREAIKKRLEELSRVDAVSLPFEFNGRYFFTKRLANQNLSVICMRKGLEGEDEVLVDPHLMSPDQTTSVGMADISRDGKLLAYQVREGGADETSVRFLDVDTHEHLPDQLAKARYQGVSLTPDKGGFYYTKHDKDGPRVYYHKMGSAASGDGEIFGKGYTADKGIGTQLTEDGRYLILTVWYGSAGRKVEIYYQDLSAGGPITPIVTDIEARFSPTIAGDHLFVNTNWNAPNGRILDIDLKNPAQSGWREVVPQSNAVISGMNVAGKKVFVNYLENVNSRVKIFEPSGKYVREIAFPAIGTVSGIYGRWESKEVFYRFTSFHIPSTIYRYDVEEGTQSEWARLKVPFKSDRFEVKQVWYESKDKTKVPMFIVHAKGIKLDGSNPTLLTGYGGFAISVTPTFSSWVAMWIEKGGVYAVPNLRGGGEFGEEWHRAGRLGMKQNVFDDFIGAAQWLVDNGYTKPSKLAIMGGSNGGLLVGAALTQRPDLFQAVVCTYPLLDMVRYHMFLFAKAWVDEYGSSDDPDQFKYLYAYSPYHHVEPGTKYPAVLMISGDLDTRVDPLHARKMTARLQAATGSDKPVLLLYFTKAGHSGGQPLNQVIDQMTDEFSFLFWQLGVGTEVRN